MLAKTSFIGWTARLLSILSLGVILIFVIGNRFSPSSLRPVEAILFLFFPVGLCVGMVVGWWREAQGAVITLISVAGFYLLSFFVSGRFPKGPYFLIVALPGLVFLISWLQNKRRPERQRAEPAA